MKSFPWIKQKDAMQCGSACLAMICMFHGQKRNLNEISKICRPSISGISVNGIEEAAEKLGLKADSRFIPYKELTSISHPVILHWNQNHFVILFKVSKNGKKFYVSDPGKGISTYSHDEFRKHWVSTIIGGEENGVVISLLPTKDFNRDKIMNDPEPRSLKFLALYLKEYKKHFIQIILGLLLGCVLQLILPFLTQSIVDIGINHNDIGFIWLIMLGELMIVIGRTSTDFIRRWLLLHISMRINISLVSDFFIKLLKLPMCFFDTKLMGDLLQRIGDHTRVQNFLTGQVLNIIFTFLSFIIFGVVLFIYNPLIFGIFAIGSMCYGVWITIFLNKRKFLDYELFEQQAKNQDKTYQFITSIQEIKLQDCEQRRRWEWEDTQAELFNVQMKSLKLQQAQEAGSIFINEIKNIIITVLAATAVINNQMTLGAMLAIQYIIGQLNSPVSQLMSFIYSFQDVKISLERINEIHEGKNEETSKNQLTYFKSKKQSVLKILISNMTHTL